MPSSNSNRSAGALLNLYGEKIKTFTSVLQSASIYSYSRYLEHGRIPAFRDFRSKMYKVLKEKDSSFIRARRNSGHTNFSDNVKAVLTIEPSDPRPRRNLEPQRIQITLTMFPVAHNEIYDPRLPQVTITLELRFERLNYPFVTSWEWTLHVNNGIVTLKVPRVVRYDQIFFQWWNLRTLEHFRDVESESRVIYDGNIMQLKEHLKRLLDKSDAVNPVSSLRFIDPPVTTPIPSSTTGSNIPYIYNYVPPTTSRSKVNFARSLNVREAGEQSSNRRIRPTDFTDVATLMKASDLSNDANSLEALYVKGQTGFFTLNSLKSIGGQIHPLTRVPYGKGNIRRASRTR